MRATFADVDSKQIGQAARNIRQNISALESVRAALSGYDSGRLEVFWQGEAKYLFVEQFGAFVAAYEKMLDGDNIIDENKDADI